MEATWHGLMADRLTRDGLEDWRARDVALGVAAWCVRESGADLLCEERLEAWLAHALSAVGRSEDAGRVSPMGRPPTAEMAGSPGLWVLAREGIFRVRTREDGRREWRLDVGRFAGSTLDGELTVCRRLCSVLVRLGEAWRSTGRDPQVSLSITGLSRLARRMEGPRAPAFRVRRRARDLRRYTEDVWARSGMGAVPLVHLDLVA